MKTGGNVLVLLNGELRGVAQAKALARRADGIVCADGGARHAKALGLAPHAIVGDMDSLPAPLPRAWTEVALVCDFDQERSDLDKTLDFVARAGAGQVWICAALGGGLDHELVNLAAIEAWKAPAQVTLYGNGRARLLGPGRHSVSLRRGARFSILAAPLARVTLTGARYGLRRALLRRGSRGLGNCVEGRAVLTVHSGRVWLADAAKTLGRKISP